MADVEQQAKEKKTPPPPRERYEGVNPWEDRKPHEPVKDRKAWFRQPKESLQAYEAFMAYLMLPSEERTIVRAAEQVGKSVRLLYRWSSKWMWTTRLGSYEEHYLLLKLESLEAQKDDMFANHRQIAQAALSIVQSHFEALISKVDDNGHLEEVKPDALVRLFAEAIKVERMAVMGRAEHAEATAEQQERLAERYSDELAELLREFMQSVDLTDGQMEKARTVLPQLLAGKSP